MKKFTEVNIRTPEGKRFIEQQLGDFPHLEKEFPLFLKMLDNGVDTATDETDAVSTPSFLSGASIDEVTYKTTPLTNADWTVYTDITAYGNVYLTETSPIVQTIIEMTLNGDKIGYSSKLYYDVQSVAIDCTGECGVSVKPTDVVSIKVTCYYNDSFNSNILKAGYIEETVLSTTGDAIKEIKCADPVKKTSVYTDMIRVAYNRGDPSSVDYILQDIFDRTYNRFAALPVNGEIVLKDGYTMSSVTGYELSMASIERGVIVYNGMPPVYVTKTAGFTWAFSNSQNNYNWGVLIPNSVRYGNETYRFSLSISFKVKNSAGTEITQEFFIASSDDRTHNERNDNNRSLKANDIPGYLEILPIQLNWGCVSKYETVLLSNGDEKSVCDIKAGDVIKTPDGTGTVTLVMSGNEEKIAKITAGGKTIRATLDHPLLTENGFLDPNSLQTGDKLVSADGGLLTIESIETEEYSDLVYSFELGSGEAFICSGFVSGTIAVQNRAFTKKPAAKVSPEAALELQKLAAHLESKQSVKKLEAEVML
jgi:hypothetical protein